MPGVRDLVEIQLKEEGTKGTAVTPDIVWRGTGSLKDMRTITEVEENVGYLMPYNLRLYQPSLLAQVTLDPTPATYQQLPILLSMAIESVVAGVADDGGSDYTYQYDTPTTAQQLPKTYTFRIGDDQRVDEAEYCFAIDWQISGAAREAWMMQATLQGRQASDAELEALTPSAVEEVLFQKSKLYIDATAGTIGTTQKTSCFLGFELGGATGYVPYWTGDGNKYFTAEKQVMPGYTGVLVLEHDATGEAEHGIAESGAIRLVRIQGEGSAFETAGTTYSVHTARIDMAIKYTDVPGLDEQEGDDVLRLPFRVLYSSADTLGLTIIVANELATL